MRAALQACGSGTRDVHSCPTPISLLSSLQLHQLPILALRLVSALAGELASGATPGTYLQGPAGGVIQGVLHEGVQ